MKFPGIGLFRRGVKLSGHTRGYVLLLSDLSPDKGDVLMQGPLPEDLFEKLKAAAFAVVEESAARAREKGTAPHAG